MCWHCWQSSLSLSQVKIGSLKGLAEAESGLLVFMFQVDMEDRRNERLAPFSSAAVVLWMTELLRFWRIWQIADCPQSARVKPPPVCISAPGVDVYHILLLAN